LDASVALRDCGAIALQASLVASMHQDDELTNAPHGSSIHSLVGSNHPTHRGIRRVVSAVNLRNSSPILSIFVLIAQLISSG
jgi:hypothetical protein